MHCLPPGGSAVGYAFDRWMIFAPGGLLHRPNLCGVPGAGGDYDRSAKGDIVRVRAASSHLHGGARIPKR
jgi:hypothetical protein